MEDIKIKFVNFKPSGDHKCHGKGFDCMVSVNGGDWQLLAHGQLEVQLEWLGSRGSKWNTTSYVVFPFGFEAMRVEMFGKIDTSNPRCTPPRKRLLTAVQAKIKLKRRIIRALKEGHDEEAETMVG